MKKLSIFLVFVFIMAMASHHAFAQAMGGNAMKSQYSFIADGNWNDGSKWSTGVVPSSGSDVVIMANAVIPAGYIAVANEVSLDGGSITVSEGGQLRHNTDNLVVTMKKNIEPYSEINDIGNYYLLSFPFSENVTVPNAMTAVIGCDFYTFNAEYPDAEWRNNREQAITTVGGTTGYLYANPEAIEISLTGSTYPSYYEETKTVTIPYTEGSTNLSNGWALLGNPFTCNAYIYCYNSDSVLVPMDFMVYNTEGELDTLSCGPIAPMQGFFVKVTEMTMVCIKNYAVHDYVDLGLPSGTLWATCNVGADAPEEYGDYFAWGETQPKDTYNWSTYQYCNGSLNSLTKYCSNTEYGYSGFSDNLTTLLPEDDVATANWGTDWRMPTEVEWQELYNNTICTWITQNGVNGRLFTASNGNSLFLPAAGDYWGSNSYGTGYNANYWSSSLNIDNPASAWGIYFSSDNYSVNNRGRSCGLSVRPVCSTSQNNAPTGAVNGKFTINANGDQVYFSQGNLQYIGSATMPYWKFADNQWDYLGTTTGQNSSDTNVDRDLFGWGTSGYNHGAVCYQPWSTSENSSDYHVYGNWEYDLYDQTNQADWGYNAITNGSNITNNWRTLTRNEWNYVFNNRNTDSDIRWTQGKVNGVNGIILLPDNWMASIYSLNNVNGGNFNSNTISETDWVNILEANGAVFLPAAGYRLGNSVESNVGLNYYWSASHYLGNSGYASNMAYGVYFFNGYLDIRNLGRREGRSVRLVRSAE